MAEIAKMGGTVLPVIDGISFVFSGYNDSLNFVV